MNRRSACICFLAVLKTSLVSSFALAAQEAVRSVSRIAGPRPVFAAMAWLFI